MTDEQFAAACAAIETIALNNSQMLGHPPYGTSRADVEAVVSMARSLRRNHRGEAERIEGIHK